MKSNEPIESLIKQTHIHTDEATRTRLHGPIQSAWQQRAHTQRPCQISLVTLKTKLVIAASILVIISATLHLLDRSTGPAYALEQSTNAIEDIKHFHFKLNTGPEQTVEREAWVQYDPNGQIKQVRVNYYALDNVMVWKEGVTQYWKQKQNALLLFEDQAYTDKIMYFVNRHDPKHSLAYLRGLEQSGKVHIEYQTQESDSDPIYFTVFYEPNTYILDAPKPAMKEIYEIDPLTKLIAQIKVFYLNINPEKSHLVWEYVDYNQPRSSQFFDLTQEVPDDCNRVDFTNTPFGLNQTTQSDQEIAIELVQAFLQAWMNQDANEAFRLHGFSDSKDKIRVTTWMNKAHLNHIQSIGQPQTPIPPKHGGFSVQAVLDVTQSGQEKTISLDFHVRNYKTTRWRIMSFSQAE